MVKARKSAWLAVAVPGDGCGTPPTGLPVADLAPLAANMHAAFKKVRGAIGDADPARAT